MATTKKYKHKTNLQDSPLNMHCNGTMPGQMHAQKIIGPAACLGRHQQQKRRKKCVVNCGQNGTRTTKKARLPGAPYFSSLLLYISTTRIALFLSFLAPILGISMSVGYFRYICTTHITSRIMPETRDGMPIASPLSASSRLVLWQS